MPSKSRHPGWYVAIALFSIAAIFYILAVPMMVANGYLQPTWYNLLIGAFLYSMTWLFVADLTYRSMAKMYSFKGRDFFPLFRILRMTMHLPHSSISTVLYALASYAFTIYGFAIAYVFVSHWQVYAFNVPALDFFDSIYFSMITITTVGYGDIVPKSSIARLLVMAEVMIGLSYVVFIFSLIGRFAQMDKDSDDD